MKGRVLKLLCLVLSIAMVFNIITIGVFATTTADDNVTLKLIKGYDSYIQGESMIPVQLQLLDTDDEQNAGYMVQAFQAYIKYDSDKLEFLPRESELFFADAAYDDVEYDAVATTNPTNGDSVIALYFYIKDGVDFENLWTVANLYFELKDSVTVGDTVDFSFDTTYEIEVITDDGKALNVTTQEVGESSVIVDGECSLRSFDSDYEDGTVNFFSCIWLSKESAVLVVKVCDETTGELKAPVQCFQLTQGLNKARSNSLMNTDEYPEGCVVQYYVWDSLITAKPLVATETVAIEY